MCLIDPIDMQPISRSYARVQKVQRGALCCNNMIVGCILLLPRRQGKRTQQAYDGVGGIKLTSVSAGRTGG